MGSRQWAVGKEYAPANLIPPIADCRLPTAINNRPSAL